MSTNRIAPRPMQPRGPDGEKLCRYCLRPVPKGRRTMCSRECAHEWMLRRDMGYVRQQVYQRDKGVCAICGVDTREVAKAIEELHRTVLESYGYTRYGSVWATWYAGLGIDRRGSLWDADHIVPVVEGGGGCGLENYRTLCVWCHRRETAELARRRARPGQQRLVMG